MDKRFYHN